MTWMLVAEQMYCEGEQVHQRDVSTTDECAIQCDGLASMFVVGTNDYGTSSQCKNGKCKCICQPNAANDGTCDQKSDNRFRLFKFKNDGNLLEKYTTAILVFMFFYICKYYLPFFILIGQSGLLPTLLDCSELYRAGFILPGFYKIDPTGNSSPSLGRNAFCENGWTHILRRMSTDQGQVIAVLYNLEYVIKCYQWILK